MTSATMPIDRLRGVLTAGVLLCLLGGVATTLFMIERQRPATARAATLSYLPKAEYLKVAVMGYRQLAADIIWLQAVQEFGKRNNTAEGYLWGYHAVDVVTDLDPQFTSAYLAAGTVLGVWGGRPEESIAILTKGIQHNPDAWELPFYIAYDYFYELCDPSSAAKYFRIASKLPGAPGYLPQLAARMTVESGDPDAALEFLYRLYDQVHDDRAREALGLRIREVTAERDIRVLERGVRQFKVRYGRLPGQPEDLVRGGILQAVPQEPLGGRYELGIDGTVSSTGLRERLRVHRRTTCEKAGRP